MGMSGGGMKLLSLYADNKEYIKFIKQIGA